MNLYDAFDLSSIFKTFSLFLDHPNPPETGITFSPEEIVIHNIKCRKCVIHPLTLIIVEIKHKLQSDTLYRLKKLYDKFQDNFLDAGFTFIVIYFDLGNFSNKLIERFGENEIPRRNNGFLHCTTCY